MWNLKNPGYKMVRITFIAKKITSLLLIFVTLSSTITSEDSTIENKSYEDYCIIALSYILNEEQSRRLPFKNFGEFAYKSVKEYTTDPVGVLGLIQDGRERRQYSLNSYDVYENLDVFVYYINYTDTQESEFFGCGLMDGSFPMGMKMSDIILTENVQKIEKLRVDDITFNRVDNVVKYSDINESLNWSMHTTYLVLYNSGSPIARGWDAYVSWISTNFYGEREIATTIIENKTTQMETQVGLKKRRDYVNEIIKNSQIIIGVSVMILVLFLLAKRRREMEEWRTDDG